MVGQVAARLGLRVSAVHFYERRGLLPPVRGQRRYGLEHLRRLVFLRMCQDAGLSLDEITVMLGSDAAVWQRMVRQRLGRLGEEIARLRRARRYLAGSLRCPADHPAAECPYVQREIDHRLAVTGESGQRGVSVARRSR